MAIETCKLGSEEASDVCIALRGSRVIDVLLADPGRHF